MIPGLREAKLSSNKIKVRLFSGEKTKDLMIHLIPNLKKSPRTLLLILGRMMRYIKTKTSCIKNSKIWSWLTILTVKIFVSRPIVRTDVKKANNVWKKYIDISKREEKNVIFESNILESHLYRGGLPLKSNGTTMLAGNFTSRIWHLWCDVDSNWKRLPKSTITSHWHQMLSHW